MDYQGTGQGSGYDDDHRPHPLPADGVRPPPYKEFDS